MQELEAASKGCEEEDLRLGPQDPQSQYPQSQDTAFVTDPFAEPTVKFSENENTEHADSDDSDEDFGDVPLYTPVRPAIEIPPSQILLAAQSAMSTEKTQQFQRTSVPMMPIWEIGCKEVSPPSAPYAWNSDTTIIE